MAAPIAPTATRVARLPDMPALAILGDPSFVEQLAQMRTHRLRGGLVQKLGHVGVDPLHDRGNVEWSVLERCEDLSLAQFAMADILANLLLSVANNRTVRGINRLDVERE